MIVTQLVSMALAGVLALGATTAVWVAFSGSDDAPPVTTYAPPRVPTVWPEAGLEGQETAQVVQDRVVIIEHFFEYLRKIAAAKK